MICAVFHLKLCWIKVQQVSSVYNLQLVMGRVIDILF